MFADLDLMELAGAVLPDLVGFTDGEVGGGHCRWSVDPFGKWRLPDASQMCCCQFTQRFSLFRIRFHCRQTAVITKRLAENGHNPKRFISAFQLSKLPFAPKHPSFGEMPSEVEYHSHESFEPACTTEMEVQHFVYFGQIGMLANPFHSY